MADRRSTYVYNQIASNRRGTSPTIRTNTQQQQKNDDNFFVKKGRSIENALGTTGSALYETGGNLLGAAFAGLTGTGYTSRRSKEQNDKTDKLLKDNKQSMEDIYKKHGYNSADDFYNASNKAEKDIFSKYGFDSDSYWDKHAKMWSPAKANDKDVLDLEATRQNVINRMSKEDADTIRKFDSIQNELKGQASKNAEAVDKNAKEYKDYVQNNYASKKINQDRGKFAGSAINTLSTATDVLGLTNGPVGNAIQGGIEGVADELEQNGLENFDWERAKQNAITGAASGAATGLVNGKIDSALAKRGGNLLKGGNRLTQAINDFTSNNALGQIGSTLASGAARGAVSGAVGGATGAGVNAALNNQDILSNALQGAAQGAQQGLTTGGIMAGANMAINNTPGVGKFLQDVNQAQRNWRDSGDNFMDRLTNTVNSGDSAVGNFINDPRQSLQNLAEKLPALGGVVKDVSGDGMLNLVSGDKLPLQGRQKSIEELSNGEYKSIGQMMNDGVSMDDIKSVLPKRTYDELVKETRNMADITNPLEQMNQYNDVSKSNLPQLNRDEFYRDTLGKVGENNVSYKDVPDYMQNHLNNNVTRSNDEILRDYFMDNGETNKYTTSELYELYDRIANGPNANEIYTPENVDMALTGSMGERGNAIANQIANRLLGNERSLSIEGGAGRAKDIPVRNDTGSWESDIASRQDEAVLNMLRSMPEDAKYTNDVRNMKINTGAESADNTVPSTQQNPATSVYNKIMQQPEGPIDLTDTFENNRLGNIEQRNKLQALGQQLQNSAKTQKYAAVYDSLDAKTARRAAETGAPQQLADLGVRPQDYNEYAKTSSYVNQVVSDLAKKSGVKVNAPDLPSKLSADNIDVVMSDSALRKYNDYIKKIVPDGDSPTQYSASYLLEKSRELGNKAANLRGNTDDVSALRQALTDAKYTLRNIATDALEGSLVTGDATNDMIAQGLKKLGANEKVQDYYTNAVDGNAPTISDYIRRSSLFEQARDMGTQIDAEKYTRSASKQPTRVATRILRASGLDQPLETLLRNTVAPVASGITNMAGKAIEGAGNVIAGVKGNNSGKGGTPTVETASTPSNINATNPSTQLFNAIGRNEGLDQAEQARTAEYLIDSAQEAEIVPNGTETAQEPQATSGTTIPGATSVYNAMTSGQPQSRSTASTNTTMATSRGGFFPETGDYWTDMISGALDRAADANDVAAFAALYGMYQNALSNAQAQQEKATQAQGKDYSNPVNWSSTDKKSLLQAQNGLDQIQSLEDSYYKAVGEGGGNGVQGTLRGVAANIFGGNLDPSAANYVSQANSIGAGIVKNLINLGSTEYDAQRYIEYLPKLTDTKEQAAEKLQKLRDAYESVIGNLYNLYSME